MLLRLLLLVVLLARVVDALILLRVLLLRVLLLVVVVQLLIQLLHIGVVGLNRLQCSVVMHAGKTRDRTRAHRETRMLRSIDTKRTNSAAAATAAELLLLQVRVSLYLLLQISLATRDRTNSIISHRGEIAGETIEQSFLLGLELHLQRLQCGKFLLTLPDKSALFMCLELSIVGSVDYCV